MSKFHVVVYLTDRRETDVYYVTEVRAADQWLQCLRGKEVIAEFLLGECIGWRRLDTQE